jgi:Ca2+-binding EF-hand superfamily protein
MGILTIADLKKLLKTNNFNAVDDTIYDIISEFDEDESGGVGFDEFIRIMK